MFRQFRAAVFAAMAAASVVAAGFRPADAAILCYGPPATLSDEFAGSDAAVMVRLDDRAPEQPENAPIEAMQSTFEVLDVLKGDETLARAVIGGKAYVKILYFGDKPVGTRFLAFGVKTPKLEWGTPIALSDAGIDYVGKLATLARQGAERLRFFQNYFEHDDPLLAADACDEVNKAPYSDLAAIKALMPREKLREWVANSGIAASRRRLYLRMLAACGTDEDAAMLETMLRSEGASDGGALDGVIGAYLTLKGPAGMPLVEDKFLKNTQAEYTAIYSAIMALRFVGTETTAIPRARLLEGLRYLLARPDLADLVVCDLARWQDWSVMPRLVELFKTADKESTWVRVPVIQYLRACPLPEAKIRLDELAKLDPDAMKRAEHYVLPTAAPPPAIEPAAGESSVEPTSLHKAGPSATARSVTVPPATAPPAPTSGRP